MQTDNLRISRTHPLISPAVLQEDCPATARGLATVAEARQVVRRILTGEDKRLLVIVGPCSIHDPDAARAYAERLVTLRNKVSDALFVVMRTYFEKPRTRVGWKGLINDPDLNGSFRVNAGLRLARRLLVDVNDLELPTATEFLDTTLGQYYTDLIAWGAIGARTVESQIHRQLASGLSMPVGFKNRTDGNIQVAVDAILAARQAHVFPSLTKEGAPALLETQGNPDGHLVLRGGEQANYDAESVLRARRLLAGAEAGSAVIVDCSHGNSRKQPERQGPIARAVAAYEPSITGIMLESHLVAGNQPLSSSLTYGQSITDACLGIDETEALLLALAER